MIDYDDVFEIPANTLLVMGPKLYNIFIVAGCYPRCHSCNNWIDEGEQFQLLSAEGTDHMVCDKTVRGYPVGGGRIRNLYCGNIDLLLQRIEDRKPRPKVGGGFSRPSRDSASEPAVSG